MKTEKGWVRGAVVIGIAGTMMAVALLSPALAVRLATTSYVKAKINQSEAAAEGRFLDVAEADARYMENGVRILERGPLSLPDGFEGFIEVICPPGTSAIGGGGWLGPQGGLFLEASYPSNGLGTDTVGTTAWTAWGANVSGSPGELWGYAVCANTTGQLARTVAQRTSERDTHTFTRPIPSP